MARKKPIISPLGQWAYPGEVTIIPSSNITMKGVNYPVLGIDNLGNSKVMMPGAEYNFPGDYVTEIPQMGKGGLRQWFAEEWTDVKTGKPCGRSGKEKGSRPYPACRPKKRVNETTPKTTSEMSSAEKAKFKREKTSGKRIDYNHNRRQDGGEEDSTIENITEFFDPTGITSYDDASRAYDQWKKSNTTLPSVSQALDMFGAVPGLGKLSKIKYLDPDAIKTAYKYIPWQQIVNAFDTVEDEASKVKKPIKKEYGGWLDQYQSGGTLPPIYTSNPRDPRIKSYKDSLNLYNEQNRLNILNNKTNYPQELANFPPIIKNNLRYTGDPNKGGYVNPKIFSSNIPTLSKDIHGNLKQQYKKPVQPVIYKKPEVSPIYTSDLNDPRLRSYRDSLYLYNKFKDAKSNYINTITSKGFDPSYVEEWTTDGYVDKGVHPKIGAIKYGILQNSGGGFDRDDKWNPRDFNTYPTKSGKQTKVYLDTDLGKAISTRYPIYKKPVQPYIYKKPIIPKVIETPVVPVPVVEPSKPSLFVSNIDRDMYTPGGGMAREYNIGVTLQDGNRKSFRTEKEFQDWKAANNLDISKAKVTEGRGYSYDYPENKKYGGWLNKYQSGGNILSMGDYDLTTAPKKGNYLLPDINRPFYKDESGNRRSEYKMGFNIDGKETLIPSVVGGKQLTDDQALERYYKTGLHMGQYNTPEEADYAARLRTARYNMLEDPIRFKADQFQTGGWANWTPNVDKPYMRNSPAGNAGYSDNTRVSSPDLNNRKAAEAAEYAKRVGSISQGKTKSNYEKAREASSLVAQAQQRKGSADPLDYVLDMVNPATYGFAGADLIGNTAMGVNNLAKGNFSDAAGNAFDAGMNALYILPAAAELRGPLYRGIPKTFVNKSKAELERQAGIDWLRNWYGQPEIKQRFNQQIYNPAVADDLVMPIYKKNVLTNVIEKPKSTINLDKSVHSDFASTMSKEKYAELKYGFKNDPIISLKYDKDIPGTHKKYLGVNSGFGNNMGGYTNVYPEHPDFFYNKFNPNSQWKPTVKGTSIHEGTHWLTTGDEGLAESTKAMFKEPFDLSKRISKQDKYLTKPTEIHARLNELRSQYNLGPTVTQSQVDKIIADGLKGNTTVQKRFFELLKDNKSLTNLFNTAMGISAPLAAASQLPEQKYGGWLNKYK